MSKLISIGIWIAAQFVSMNSKCQSISYPIMTNCGFEVTFPNSFVKSNSFGYRSNTTCFDTVLTNNLGCFIHVFGINYPHDPLDTSRVEVAQLLKGYNYELRKMNIVTSKIVFINNIKVGLLTYFHKSEANKKDKKIYQNVFFVSPKNIKCIFEFIMNSNQFNSGINMRIINTIRFLNRE